MINKIILDNEIKVWWEYEKLEGNSEFILFLDGKEQARTKKSHFNVKNLAQDTEYEIKVELQSPSVEITQIIGKEKIRTLKTKNKIDVTKPPYNAVGDGKKLNTKALQQAINDCGKDDCVYFPDGEYLTGALDLKSNIQLSLSDGAVILGSSNEKDYLPKIKSRFEGYEKLCYRSLLNAGEMSSSGGANCENIIIQGGKIFGGGKKLRENIIKEERPSVLKQFGLENELNPPFYYSTALPARTRGKLLGFNNVKNVIIANSEMGNSPAWNLHFTYCENIATCGCKIVSQGISNGDGWDPDSSKNCVLFDTEFETSDDCVAIKSGRNLEGYLVGRPCENIRVFDITTKDGHGIAIGSEMSGGIKDVRIWNCNVSCGMGIYFKTMSTRGGYIKDVKVSNCFAPTVSVSTRHCTIKEDGEPAPVSPEISDLVFEDITVTGINFFTGEHNRIEPETAFVIRGENKENPIKDVTVKNLTLMYRQMIPNQIILFKDVENIKLEGLTCKGEI